MRRAAKWTIGILVVLVVLIGGASAVAWTMARPFAERQLSAQLGRRVSIGGISISPSFSVPRVTFSDIRIANPEGWAPDPPFARAARATVDIDLRQTLGTRAIVLPMVTVENPVVAMLARGETDNNYTFALPPPAGEPPEGQPPPPSRLRIGALRVLAGEVHVGIDQLGADLAIGIETRDYSA